jgi:hypothetical protein
VAGGRLTFATSAVADTGGNATLKLQYGSNAPPGSWAKVNVVLDVSGSPSAIVVADGITLDSAGGPQPQLGPIVFTANQNVSIIVTGCQPSSQVVAHVNGAWDTDVNQLQSIGPLSGGTIGAQQLVGTPFQENQALSIAPGATYTSPVYPMLGYSAIFVQYIVTVGALTSMPTVQVQWLDTSTPPINLFQSNWQAQKIIDVVAAWGQQMQILVTNNDGSHTCNMAMTLVPVATPPARKADALTYKTTALNELVSIRNTVCAATATITATTPAGLGWSGPATVYLDCGVTSVSGSPSVAPCNFDASISYGPQGTGKTLWHAPVFCPNILGMPIDLPDQPLTLSFTNWAQGSVTPAFAVMAGYR